jgi:CRP/FNR family transcriptional regulator, cyclic AMP receptor protein
VTRLRSLFVADMVELSAHLPLVEVAAGDTLVQQGEPSGAVWVLVSGALEVFQFDVSVNTITKPGAVIGEMSVLLGAPSGAGVVATEPSRLRYAADGHAFLFSDTEITRLIAVGLAERLTFVTTYLADLKYQYGDATGLSMVSEVLTHLAHRQVPSARSGSARDPEPEY